jgi:hypothetical protein
MGKNPYRSQPISISQKPLETVPHVVQREARFKLISGLSLWEPDGQKGLPVGVRLART